MHHTFICSKVQNEKVQNVCLKEMFASFACIVVCTCVCVCTWGVCVHVRLQWGILCVEQV